MNNEERDAMLIEMHADIKLFTSKVDEHDKTLYGNSKPGLSKDVTLLQERQEACPARIANQTDSKRLNIARVAVILMAITFVMNLVFHLWLAMKGAA